MVAIGAVCRTIFSEDNSTNCHFQTALCTLDDLFYTNLLDKKGPKWRRSAKSYIQYDLTGL